MGRNYEETGGSNKLSDPAWRFHLVFLLFTEYADMLVSCAGGRGLSDPGPLSCRRLLVVSLKLFPRAFSWRTRFDISQLFHERTLDI